MHSKNLFFLLFLFIFFNAFSQSDVNDVSNDSLQDLSSTNEVVDLFSISLSDDELNDDTYASDNISGLLNSSMDIFYRTAAYEFGSSFFKVRGLDSDNATVQILSLIHI